MSKLKVVVENTIDGFSAYVDDNDIAVATVGDSFDEIKKNILEAINLHNSYHAKKNLKENDIVFVFDLGSFFRTYSVINASALAQRIGMNQTLLAQYTSGKKMPSENQMERIYKSIHDIATELGKIKLASRDLIKQKSLITSKKQKGSSERISTGRIVNKSAHKSDQRKALVRTKKYK